MLKFLHIENIAVIESCDIEFSRGFNVLTGETGAGKSIVIDAINAVLGERTSKDLIRAGCDEAFVSAVFGDLSEETAKSIAEYELAPDEDEDDDIIEIPDEDVPRADVPKTGDPILQYVGLAITSGVAAILVGKIGKKKEDEE